MERINKNCSGMSASEYKNKIRLQEGLNEEGEFQKGG
jgi:hypothetical protein